MAFPNSTKSVHRQVIAREVSYYHFSNEAHLELIKKLVDKYQYLIPPWISRVTVQMSHLDYNVLAQTDTDSSYLFAKVSIGDSFFDNTAEVMEWTFVHELVHVSISELSDWFYDMLKAADIDKVTRNVIEKERRIRNERLTEFITTIVRRPDDLSKEAKP